MGAGGVLLLQMADYAVAERRERLPAEVVHHAKRAVIDWFAALLPGGVIPPATLLRQALARDIGRGAASLYPGGERAGARTAALINGTASHTLEFDDIFRDAIYHPGCPVIGAALASAQAAGATGDMLLRAVVVGYELSTRIGVVVNPAHYKFWHTTGTVGTFGAAAAAGVVLGLTREQQAHALATAGTLASGLQQAFRSDAMSKPLHAGHAAETGVFAAQLAAAGVTGALDILEGEAGFGRAMSHDCDWSKALAELGTRYNITQVTQKNHSCCGHTFAAIDGVLALRAKQISPDRVRRIVVRTYKTALDVAGIRAPSTEFEAKFSLPYVVATALVHGSVRLEAFAPQRLADPVVRGLMERVELQVDPEIDAKFPAQRAAHVTIETADGASHSHFQPTRIGDPDQPLSDQELEAKYRELVDPVVGSAAAQSLLAAVWSLERLTSVRLPAAVPRRRGRARRSGG